MPDKRDMHKAKSHRNSKTAKQQAAPQRRADRSQAQGTMAAALDESAETSAPEMRGKRNKSGR